MDGTRNSGQGPQVFSKAAFGRDLWKFLESQGGAYPSVLTYILCLVQTLNPKDCW